MSYINNFSDPFKDYIKTNKNGIIYLGKSEINELISAGTMNNNDVDMYKKYMDLNMNDGILYMAGLILLLISFILLILINIVYFTYNLMEIGNKHLPIIENDIISNKPLILTTQKEMVASLKKVKKGKKTKN